MNKGVAITLIVILSIIAIALTGGFIFLLRGNFEWGSFNLNFGSYSEKLVDSKTYESAEEINVDAKTIDVFVEESIDEKITVELYSDKEVEYSFTENEGVLNFKAHYKSFSFGLFNKSAKLVVKVPKTYDKKFSIDSKTGDIHIASLENLTATIKATTGDVKITKINEATIDLGTGDVKVQEAKVLNVKQGTGDTKVDSVDYLDVNASTGDVKIQTVNNKVNITNTTGDIKIQTATITEDSNISNRTGDIKITSLTGAYVEADNNVGDTKVNNNDRKSELTIKIHTNTGDIRVN